MDKTSIENDMKTITLETIDEDKLKSVNLKLNAEITATGDTGAYFKSHIWITNLEKFYGLRKDLKAIIIVHYIVQIKMLCRKIFPQNQMACYNEIFFLRRTKEGEKFSEYKKYFKERKRVIERLFNDAKKIVLKDIIIANNFPEPRRRHRGAHNPNRRVPMAPPPGRQIFEATPHITAPDGRIFLPGSAGEGLSRSYKHECINCGKTESFHIESPNYDRTGIMYCRSLG